MRRRQLDILLEEQLQEWIARWAADVPAAPELDARIIAAVKAAPRPPGPHPPVEPDPLNHGQTRRIDRYGCLVSLSAYRFHKQAYFPDAEQQLPALLAAQVGAITAAGR